MYYSWSVPQTYSFKDISFCWRTFTLSCVRVLNSLLSYKCIYMYMMFWNQTYNLKRILSFKLQCFMNQQVSRCHISAKIKTKLKNSQSLIIMQNVYINDLYIHVMNLILTIIVRENRILHMLINWYPLIVTGNQYLKID